MDEISRAFYEIKFENSFLKNNAMAFQNFFTDIMEKRHLSDFIKVRPWGSRGDEKCDGYLKSRRMLFQAYAPNTMTEGDTIQKMEEDYVGALPHWRDYFDTWVFVHNSKDGLGPEQSKKLLQLDRRTQGVRCVSWAFAELRAEIFQLNDTDIASILGCAPSRQAIVNLRSAEIAAVIRALPDIAEVSDGPVRPVRSDKILANQLSPSASTLLRAGMEGANKVKWYLNQQSDKTLGDKIAQTLYEEYVRFERLGGSSNQIFSDLHEYVLGSFRGNADHESAGLAILAFYFEQCDIFKEPA